VSENGPIATTCITVATRYIAIRIGRFEQEGKANRGQAGEDPAE
jgi:hypothetical protein